MISNHKDKVKDLAIITRVTENKEYTQVKMQNLKKDDLFLMENIDGELISVNNEGQFILKAIENPDEPIHNCPHSIKCMYYA
jgi:hypothetical protein